MRQSGAAHRIRRAMAGRTTGFRALRSPQRHVLSRSHIGAYADFQSGFGTGYKDGGIKLPLARILIALALVYVLSRL